MKTILVPCDFSKAAMNAIRSAISFSKGEKTAIHLLYVIELPVVHDSVLMPVMQFEESLLRELKQKADATFSRIVAEFEGCHAELVPVVQFGPVARVILRYIDDQSIDLVVMGTKGSTGLYEMFIGSNTEKIVRASASPVLVVRNPVDFTAMHEMVFPTNMDFESMEEVMQRVKLLQGTLGARLHLVWINTPSNFESDGKSLARLHEVAKRYMLANYTVNVFNDNQEETGIINFAHQMNADLLVMATHGRKGLAHLFSGSLTEDVVNHIDIPVWTFSLAGKEAKVNEG